MARIQKSDCRVYHLESTYFRYGKTDWSKLIDYWSKVISA